ncbi:type II toxin-antitoxin system ParD family antitoxin [Xanthomonadaceae bacterium XH05]|nr:type II toxin-antitoxin system ParD family antitoxin [Xanthomonadaceae bacterium XH05]
MPVAEKRTISLPSDQAAFVDAKVRAGDYASVSEVVRAGLRALKERDDAVEQWLRNEVASTFMRCAVIPHGPCPLIRRSPSFVAATGTYG